MLRRILAFVAGLLLWTAAAAQGGAFERGLLWEISRPGVAPSYLFGTMHVADPRVLALPPEVETAFTAARTFVLELYPDEAVARRFADASLLEGEERLSGLLPAATFDLLAGRLAQRGLARNVVDRLKPWAALLISTEHAGGNGESLDISLYVRARFANMRVEELDSVDEQIAVFDALPRDTQLALLQRALERHAVLHEDLEEGIHAYLRGDLAALDALAWRNGSGDGGPAGHYARFEKKIIHDRSVVMAHRLQMHLRRGATFAAVGALHLYGELGMLRLLQDEGWDVRPLR